MNKVALKYCGSCNPTVDLPAVARHLGDWLSQHSDFELVNYGSGDIDVLVLLCGCARACVNRKDIVSVSRRCVVVAGATVNGASTPEHNLASKLMTELQPVIPYLIRNPGGEG